MSSGTARDVRIDLLRGLAIVAMIVDHVAGSSPLRLLTGGDRFYTSAAEGFVVLAGITAGMLSARAVARGTLSTTLRRFVARAGMLYLLACAITLVELPVSESLGLPWARGIDLHQPLTVTLDVLTLGQTYHVVDVLVLYALLFLLAPLAAHLLATGRTRLLLAGSICTWLGYQFAPQAFNLPWFVGRDGSYGFPLAAWQVVFCLAMVVGYHRCQLARGLNRVWRNRLLVAATLMSIGLVVLYNHARGALPLLDGARSTAAGVFGQDDVWQTMMGRGWFFAKDSMRFGRLVASASLFSLLFALSSVLGQRTRAAAEWLLLPFGRHSLLAFGVHLAVLVGIGIAAEAGGTAGSLSPLANASLQVLAVAFVWISVQLLSSSLAWSWRRPRLTARLMAFAWQSAVTLTRG